MVVTIPIQVPIPIFGCVIAHDVAVEECLYVCELIVPNVTTYLGNFHKRRGGRGGRRGGRRRGRGRRKALTALTYVADSSSIPVARYTNCHLILIALCSDFLLEAVAAHTRTRVAGALGVLAIRPPVIIIVIKVVTQSAFISDFI